MSMMKKPEVVKKVHSFIRNVKENNNQIGKIPRAITLNYNNVCNFKCDFCFSAEETNEHIKCALDFDSIRDLANQADRLGIWEIVLTGGELLVDLEKLYSLVEAFGPERFQMILISNGYLMTKEIAVELEKRGLDCVGISLSGMDEEEHNRSRGGVKDAHKRALAALDYVNEAGMAAWPNLIFGHHNSKSPDLYAALDYAKEKGYTTYFMMAMPFGAWKDNIMDAEDMKILNDIRKKYDCCFDTWDMYDRKKEKITGCWTVNRTYITPLGDVLVCPYMNIKIGNILEQPLKEILDYGFSIKHFGGYSAVCLSAHNRQFRKKFLPEEGNIFQPYDAKELFKEEDYLEDGDRSNVEK